jgi:hypothetical protein
MYRLTLKFVLSAILAVALLVSYAFAQRECGPSSKSCTLHHEHCTCSGK